LPQKNGLGKQAEEGGFTTQDDAIVLDCFSRKLVGCSIADHAARATRPVSAGISLQRPEQ
jgi:hypothetical protein